MKIVKEKTRAPFNHGGLCVLLCLCGIVLMNILPLPCFGTGAGNAEQAFSVTSTNEPLYEVLARISEATGYQIQITKGWEKIPITAKLDNVTLEEGIKEIIRSMGRPNYAMTINDGMKKVEIKIYDAATGYPPVTGNSLEELRQKQTEAALAPYAAPTGQNKGTGADAGTKNDSPKLFPPDKKDLPTMVESDKRNAERDEMERKIEAERAERERRMAMEMQRQREEPLPEILLRPPVEIIPPN